MKKFIKEAVLVVVGTVAGACLTITAAIFSGENLIRSLGGVAKSDVIQLESVANGGAALASYGEPQHGLVKQVGLYTMDANNLSAKQWRMIPVR